MEKSKINYIFEILQKIWFDYNIENKIKLRGISDNEYIKLIDVFGRSFPYAFSLYLQRYAGEPLNIHNNISHNYTGIMESQDIGRKLLKKYNKTIPSNSFIFGQNSNCTIYYFVDNHTNNPNIYIMTEELNNDNEYELNKYSMGLFTDWIINQTINSLVKCKGRNILDKTIILEELKESTNGT